jgi:hypothetical protein
MRQAFQSTLGLENNPTKNTSLTTKMPSSTTRPPASSSTTAQQPGERSFFEQQREVLLKEIGIVSFLIPQIEVYRVDMEVEFRARSRQYQQIKSVTGGSYCCEGFCNER